jgi:hypothetical protein
VGSSRQFWQTPLLAFIILQQLKRAQSKAYVTVPKTVPTTIKFDGYLSFAVQLKVTLISPTVPRI